MLARGETTARALLDQVLERLDRDGDRFHAMLAFNPHAARDAEAADRARSQGTAAGPLHGIPLVLKDNIDLAGMPTTSGCRALAGAMPRRSAIIVERLRDAGAVIVGKTNLSEFSFEIRSRSSLGGDVLHPRAPHASAGDRAAAPPLPWLRAMRWAGSARTPAVRSESPQPTTGWSDSGPPTARCRCRASPLAPSTDTVGPIARTVADAELLLAAMGHGVRVRAATPDRGGARGVRRQRRRGCCMRHRARPAGRSGRHAG
jgi:Asp-tRNA(Asn)/Glu-tRNA(Gln) amidotransferase A subunit family amidase